MSLYPITVMQAAALSLDPNPLAAGSLIVVPIDMTSIQMMQFTLQQMANTQDFSMRAWVSVYKDGIALGDGIYALLKFGGAPIVVHTASQTPPDNVFSVGVTPGLYFLNILNLTNVANVFGFSKTNLA